MSLFRSVSSSWFAGTLLAVLVSVCLASSVSAAGPPTAATNILEVASGGNNVWVVTKDPAMVGRWRLLHHFG